jgi:hypothetical protein
MAAQHERETDAALTLRLGDVRAKRDRLLGDREAEAKMGTWWPTFAAHHERFGRASKDAIAAAESQCGGPLPEMYRRFVEEIADGGIGPGCGMFALSEAIGDAPELTGELSRPFCYGNADAEGILARRRAGDRDAWLAAADNEDAVPHGCLLLAHTGCGCFDVLVITGEQRGTVWYHDFFRLCPYGWKGEPMTFLDWYEGWLDGWLAKASR